MNPRNIYNQFEDRVESLYFTLNDAANLMDSGNSDEAMNYVLQAREHAGELLRDMEIFVGEIAFIPKNAIF